ncbi:MAG TPA: thiamine pyrophosphate-dependent enzyme, partial [Candidatus Berkiella sp.]|nr:thiamine pyrophosphate-dependent enzyme [Candidatus Berkiella sp.]
ADDPEAVMLVTEWVLDYRMRFNKDVVIDLVCYRRHGHNEADDPFATQPMMYGKIKNHLTVRQLYAEQLTKEQVLTKQQADDLVKRNREALDKGNCVANNISKEQRAHIVDWNQFESKDWREPVKTGISQ